jgi:3-methyladenine DNA glycosylase AlkD
MKTATAAAMRQALVRLSDGHQAEVLARFFKTGPGEYGEGDCFRGIRVPQLRKLVAEFTEAPLTEALPLLSSPWHEDRLFALLLLVDRYKKGDEALRGEIYRKYMSFKMYINNWDLVDLSAGQIPGAWLYGRSRKPLYALAGSPGLWDRRIALIATFNFIKQNDFTDTLAIAALYLSDKEDLIHKATGWMLREIGKRDMAAEERFLQEHLPRLPRTTLRYAIERFPEGKRLAYLRG